MKITIGIASDIYNTIETMLDINNKRLGFSGFSENQDLIQKTGVPLVYQITNGTVSRYLPSFTTAPIINPYNKKEVTMVT